MTYAFPQLLRPHVLASRNRARRRERGDLMRAVLFGAIGLLVCGALFQGSFWLTSRLDAYDELGDYLLRIGLSWLFLTFLSFLAFSAVVTALSTFFLSEDLRLLLTAPVPLRRLFHARFFRTVGQSSWMVVIFLAPVLMGIGRARCAGLSFYLTSALTTVPFAIIPVAAGTLATLFLVNTFPARRARDLLMLMGLLFAASLVILLRFIRPEQLLKVESLPAKFPYKVGLHQSCHGQRGLHLAQMSELVAAPFSKPLQLLNLVEGIELIPLNRVDECCGFGGTFCVFEEAVSAKMGKDRVADHSRNGAEVITGVDMSCLMHMDGILKRQKSHVQVRHLAEILNSW